MQGIVYDIKPAGWLACLALRRLWRGCLLTRLNGLSLREMPVPSLPGDDWVRVRTLLGGICGTDLAILQQRQWPNSILQAFSSLPMIMGHENVAVVEDVGPAVDASWKGKRVCVEPTLGCIARGIEPLCEPCSRGQFGACENFGAAGMGKYALPAGTSIGYNSRTGGSYGQYFVAHQSQLVAVPPGLTDEQAVLTDPLSCSMHAILRARLDGARRVLVYGLGTLGLGLVAGLRAMDFGGIVDAVGRSEYSAALAGGLGVDHVYRLPADKAARFEQVAARTGARAHRVRLGNWMLSGGYDVVFDCLGSAQSIEESIKWTAARGQMVMVGTGNGAGADLTAIWFRELEVLGAYGRQMEQVHGRGVHTYALVLELLASGKLNVAHLLTHKFPLRAYREAFGTAMNKSASRAVKVAIDFR